MPVVYPSTPDGIAALASRFWPKVRKSDDPDGCWEWVAMKNPVGYGRFQVRPMFRNIVAAHRVAFFLHNGSLDPDLIVCHKCDNPSCVRPDHLFEGTYKDNMQDCKAKGRYKALDSHLRVLTDDQILEILSTYTPGSGVKLGQKFGVSRSAICRVVRGTSKVARGVGTGFRETSCNPCGEDRLTAKLTWENVRAIRAEYVPGKTKMQDIGKKYGVCKDTISNVVNGTTWREENGGRS